MFFPVLEHFIICLIHTSLNGIVSNAKLHSIKWNNQPHKN